MNLIEYASVIINQLGEGFSGLIVAFILVLVGILFTLRQTGQEIILLFVISASAFATLGLGPAFDAIKALAFGLAILAFGIMFWKNFMGG